MPLSFDEFMKKTNHQGFTSEEQELLASFGKALEKAYESMCAEDENSERYEEYAEIREALGKMQGNSVFGPVPDDDDEEKKKKWDEDSLIPLSELYIIVCKPSGYEPLGFLLGL